jgi:DNA-binding MarR family transcriptional regulator
MAGTLIRTMRFIDDAVRQQAEDSLGVAELGILGQIERGVDLPSGLARSLRIDPSKITRMVDHLVVRGYVRRGFDSHDRRRCPLSVTAEGRARLTEGRTAVEATMDMLLESLPPGDRASLAVTLDHLRDALDRLPQI